MAVDLNRIVISKPYLYDTLSKTSKNCLRRKYNYHERITAVELMEEIDALKKDEETKDVVKNLCPLVKKQYQKYKNQDNFADPVFEYYLQMAIGADLVRFLTEHKAAPKSKRVQLFLMDEYRYQVGRYYRTTNLTYADVLSHYGAVTFGYMM